MTRGLAKSAFTLIELLVVSALFLLFFSLVINAARPNPASQVRQLTQDLSSAILAAQTRAMQSDAGAALMIDTGMSSSMISGTAVFTALPLPMLTGSISPGWIVTGGTSLTGDFSPTNADPIDLSACFAVRLFRQLGPDDGVAITPWLEFRRPDTACLDASASQTVFNTVLPEPPTPLSFVGARYPAQGELVVGMPRYAAIDLRYSGIGMAMSPAVFFGILQGNGMVSLRFDRTGCLDKLTRDFGTPAALTPSAPMYLLVATTNDIQNNTSLRSPLSRWIAIAPDTGRMTVALNVAGTYATPPTAADINNARSNVRQAITQGAR